MPTEGWSSRMDSALDFKGPVESILNKNMNVKHKQCEISYGIHLMRTKIDYPGTQCPTRHYHTPTLEGIFLHKKQNVDLLSRCQSIGDIIFFDFGVPLIPAKSCEVTSAKITYLYGLYNLNLTHNLRRLNQPIYYI